MYITYASWGSPVGIGIFFAGMGIFCWGFFLGIAAIMRAKHSMELDCKAASHRERDNES